MGYIYIIKHIKSNKYYVGSKYSKKDSDPKLLLSKNGYHTNSTIVKRLIKLYGLESFKIVAIREYKNSEALLHETIFLRKWNIASRSNWLNCHNNDNIIDENYNVTCKKYKDIFTVEEYSEMMAKIKQDYWDYPGNRNKWSNELKNMWQNGTFSNSEGVKNHWSNQSEEYIKDRTSKGLSVRNAKVHTCNHCGKQNLTLGNLNRWHLNNCKNFK